MVTKAMPLLPAFPPKLRKSPPAARARARAGATRRALLTILKSELTRMWWRLTPANHASIASKMLAPPKKARRRSRRTVARGRRVMKMPR